MKSSEIYGYDKVFTFTLVQTVKNKAYIIYTVILVLLAILSMPILSVINSSSEDSKVEKSEITTAYIYDDTAELFGTSLSQMGLDWGKVCETPAYSDVKVVMGTKPYEEMLDVIEEKEGTSVVCHLMAEHAGLQLEILRSTKDEVTNQDMEYLCELLQEDIKEFKGDIAALSEEQKQLVTAEILVEMNYTAEDGTVSAEEDTTINSQQYWVLYAILFVVLMVSIVASSQVANSIVMDKSTRVVEYLLTSVRPMALVVGKVFATLIASVGQMAVMFLLLLASNKITQQITGSKNVLESYVSADIWKNLTPVNILLAFVAICLGFILLAVLAAMCGATVSKIENVQEGLTLLTITSLVGVYIALGAANALQIGGDSPFVTFSLLFPLSSPFLLPGAIMIGKVSLGMCVLAILILAVAVFLFFRFVATIYELLITHNGDTIKPKELLGLYKSVKKGGRKA